jgi:hypothetical protein
MLTGMKAPNAIQHPCKKRTPEHIKAYIRWFPSRTFSPSVSGTSVASDLHLVYLTESGAQPNAELALLLLLLLPLLLTLTKLADDPAIRKCPY